MGAGAQAEFGVQVPSAGLDTENQSGEATRRSAGAGMRGLTHRPRPIPSPPSSPHSDNSSGNPLPASAPPTPRPAARSFPPRGLGEDRGGRHPLPRSPTAQPAAPSPEPRAGSGEPGAPVPALARRRPGRFPRPLTVGPDAGRAQGAGRRARTSPLRPWQEPLLGAARASAAVSTRPLSGPDPRKSTSGGAGEGRLWHRNCSRAGVAGASGSERGGACPARQPHSSPGLPGAPLRPHRCGFPRAPGEASRFPALRVAPLLPPNFTEKKT